MRDLEPQSQKEPITIGFVIFGLAFGGAEVVLLELIKGLDRSRFRPVVISLAPPAALSPAFAAANVDVHHLGMKRIEQAPVALFRAWRLARTLRPALLHGFMFYGDLTARLIRIGGGAPRVVTALHSTSIGTRKFEHVMHWSDRYTDAVTAVSNEVARAQIAAGSVSPDKVTVIYNGIDLARFAPPPEDQLDALRKRLDLPLNARILLSVGRLEPEKDHALLLRAFKQLLSRQPDIVLLLVGPGRLDKDLRALANTLGIEKSVRFAGQVSPVAPAFYLADAFVLSSWREGLPLVVLEAMASRVPMVLTSVGGIPEIVEHEKNGLLVPPRNETALVAALERMFAMSPEERSALAQAAYRTVSERFSMQHMVAATQDLYERVLHPKSKSELRSTRV